MYPFDRGLGEPRSRCGRYAEVKILYTNGTQTLALRPSSRQQTTQHRQGHATYKATAYRLSDRNSALGQMGLLS
jgi:hypothetical protein